MGDLSRSFSSSEFASKDGSAIPAQLQPNLKKLAMNLQVLRDAVGKPIVINSGYRSPAHNAKVGGASGSQHQYARAADIRVAGMTPAAVYQKIEQLIKEGKMAQGGLGLYRSWVHYDVRGSRARWNG